MAFKLYLYMSLTMLLKYGLTSFYEVNFDYCTTFLSINVWFNTWQPILYYECVKYGQQVNEKELFKIYII